MMTLQEAKKALSLPKAAEIPVADEKFMQTLLKKHKISNEEFKTIRNIISRAPTLAEIGVFSAMWSEHCSYKSSRVHLKRFPTTGENVVVGPGENAGVVRLWGHLCVAFKMESHNHPSYIEPYQGAATGVGGILRDVFCMGARPIANLNCLRFGDRSHARTPALVKGVVKGIGDYGNCVGIATVGGSVSYDATYNGNCLVNAMTVGLIRDDKIFKGFASGVGNLVVYVGSATGRDGIHGATMASDSFATQDEGERSTVQVGDPFAEKLLLEATLEVLDKGLVVGIQDMGAAGLTSSSFEMAGRAGNGLYIDLDKVPLRAKAMSAYEIMLSESQERMLMVIEPSRWNELAEVLQKWQLAHAVIGVVTDTGRMQISAQGKLEIDLPVAPLTDNAPVYSRPMAPGVLEKVDDEGLKSLSRKLHEDAQFLRQTILRMLSDTGNKTPIFEQYDRHIGKRTVWTSDHGGAGVLWVRTPETVDKPYLGIAVAAGCNERQVANRPRVGAAHAVLKCARSLFAAGAEPLAITDCLNFGSAEDPDVMRAFSDAVDGISDACRALQIPVVSGNVSLYNSTDQVSIHPTPMIGMVGRVDDVRNSVPALCQNEEPLFALTPKLRRVTFAASLAAKVNGHKAAAGFLPEIDWDAEMNAVRYLRSWHQRGLLVAARDVGEGGLVLTALKMMMSSPNVFAADFSQDHDLCGESGATYVLQFKDRSSYEHASQERHVSGIQLKLLATLARNPQGLVRGPWGSYTSEELKATFNASQPI